MLQLLVRQIWHHVSMCVPQVRTYGCGIAAQTDTMRNKRYYVKYAPANNMREGAHAAKTAAYGS